MLVMAIGAVPRLVRVTARGLLVAPTGWFPKFSGGSRGLQRLANTTQGNRLRTARVRITNREEFVELPSGSGFEGNIDGAAAGCKLTAAGIAGDDEVGAGGDGVDGNWRSTQICQLHRLREAGASHKRPCREGRQRSLGHAHPRSTLGERRVIHLDDRGDGRDPTAEQEEHVEAGRRQIRALWRGNIKSARGLAEAERTEALLLIETYESQLPAGSK